METAENPLSEGKKKAREVEVFTLPPSLANGITSIGLTCLTADEEIMAYKRAGGDPPKVAEQLCMASLAEVNNKPVSLADGTADKAWSDMEPKVRNLVQKAWSDLHSPSGEEEASFLKSRKTRVG